jgi:flagellar protein FlgJ
MLPSQAESVFGQGVAGEMWKGMLADELGKQLARSGGIGIAASIYKAHPNAAKTPGLSRSTFGAAAAATLSFPSSAQAASAPASPEARTAMLAPMDISPAAGGGTSTSERTP